MYLLNVTDKNDYVVVLNDLLFKLTLVTGIYHAESNA